jgi:hypothetical protein
LVSKIGDESAETIRIQICAYMVKAAMGAKNDKSAINVLPTLAAFSEPYGQTEGMGKLIVSIGDALFRR